MILKKKDRNIYVDYQYWVSKIVNLEGSAPLLTFARVDASGSDWEVVENSNIAELLDRMYPEKDTKKENTNHMYLLWLAVAFSGLSFIFSLLKLLL